MVLLESGLVLFSGEQPTSVGYVWRFAPFVTGFAWFTYATPNMPARVTILSAGVFLLSLRCAVVVSRKIPRILSGGNGLLTLSFASLAALNALRLVVTLSGANPQATVTITGGWHNVAILGSTMATVLLYTGFVTIHSQRLERDLIVARDAIKTLEGLLPVCSGCKKIRDAAGAWNPFEFYIARHTEARFSHGFCPDCASSYFPDFPGEIPMS